MLVKQIVFLGGARLLACDGRCHKAWGIQARPRRALSSAEDDFVYLGDDVLGTAPGPGKTEIVSEGVDCKPSAVALDVSNAQRMNRWCARQCERVRIFEVGVEVSPLRLPDMVDPLPNFSARRVR